MNFNPHYNLEGKHAFLSASNSHWVNYNENKLVDVYRNTKAKEEGTALHELASNLIDRRIKLAGLKKAFNMFVNDAIGFGMSSEVVLYYSDNCFGTADAILFKNNLLQIHDLKTGVHKVSFRQLNVYAALFCLEYGHNPEEIEIQQRIYQGRGFEVNVPFPEDVRHIMDTIVKFDEIIEEIKYQ